VRVCEAGLAGIVLAGMGFLGIFEAFYIKDILDRIRIRGIAAAVDF